MRDTVSASNEGEGAECRLALFFSSLLGQLPTLEQVFSQLVQQDDMEARASRIASVVSR
jgi:hypothetical protein